MYTHTTLDGIMADAPVLESEPNACDRGRDINVISSGRSRNASKEIIKRRGSSGANTNVSGRKKVNGNNQVPLLYVYVCKRLKPKYLEGAYVIRSDDDNARAFVVVNL